jgi:uncharacterized membrane protein
MNQKTIGIVVAVIGMLCAVLSLIVVVIQSPMEGSILSLFFVAVCAAVYWKIIRPILQSRALLKTGMPADAIVIKGRDTGTTVNNSPKVELLLEVRPENDAPFQVKTTQLVSRLQASLLQSGTSVQVMYDPADRTKVALSSVTGSATAKNSRPAERLDQLSDLKSKGLITEEEYRQKRKDILRDL